MNENTGEFMRMLSDYIDRASTPEIISLFAVLLVLRKPGRQEPPKLLAAREEVEQAIAHLQQQQANCPENSSTIERAVQYIRREWMP